ncbi:MAG TPA: hypothetical protein VI030_10085 [Propionibacteriaceae bacterium]
MARPRERTRESTDGSGSAREVPLTLFGFPFVDRLMASCLQRLVPVTPRLRLGVGVGVVALDAFGAVDRSTASALLDCSFHLAGLPAASEATSARRRANAAA